MDYNKLLHVMIDASILSWNRAIKPRINQIRQEPISKNLMKGEGTDFFTQADVESENIIIEELKKHFGENTFRIYGEEHNTYMGNLDADFTIRIDPIDGTEAFKFGKPNWSIMIGLYVGRNEKERQVLATVYYPEYYNEILFFSEADGINIKNLQTGEIRTFTHIDPQNDLGNILIAFYKHSDLHKRGKIDEIIFQLEKNGARVKSITPTEVKEALLTKGKRAMIIDGDFNQVDFIGYSSLGRLGYKVFDWEGREYSLDDPSLTDKKLIIIPPGKAGEEIVELIKNFV